MQNPNYGSDPTSSPHTTFVQADPSNFRSIVQKLTGASDDTSAPKLPLTLPSSSRANDIIRRPPFKLHERRQRKLDQIQLSNSNRMIAAYHLASPSSKSPTSSSVYYLASSSTSPSNFGCGRRAYGGEMAVMVSPVSPLDLFTRPGQSSSLLSPSEQEEKAIAEKGFYLHPSPRSTPRGPDPELLPLFPLHYPRDHDHNDHQRP